MNNDPSETILIVEDSPEDYEATVRIFRKAGLANPIHHCENDEEALDYLYRTGIYADREKSPRPCLILLDLNMPGLDGRGLLTTIKSDANLKIIPVVVLTVSIDKSDIDKCCSEGANSYIHKPVDFNGLIDAIQRLKDYWFEIVILPKVE
jgi:two-component system, response regulator